MPLPLLMELVNKSAEYLLGHGIANGRREAEWIFAETLGLTRLDLYTRFDMPLEEPQVARLRELVARRGRREPLAYVLGNQEFCGLRLTITPAVLVPRPETEELVALVIAALPAQPLRLLDVGTGSGAIALALKKARPDCRVEATDESAEALAVAKANAARLGLEVAWHQGHLARHLAGPYDAVVANLPYVGQDERAECDPEIAFEPASALFAGPDGMRFIAELVADAPRFLADDGVLWLEHGFRQGPAVGHAAATSGLDSAILADAAGHQRFARLDRSRP